MRDGVHLAADLYMPATPNSGQQFPVVMEYSPYRKDEANLAHRDFYVVLPRYGYVVARVDIRGTGASEGVSTDEYTLQEQLDGYDTIEWLARQPWCSGHINMIGISYPGFTALQVAAHNPPHLTSIIPVAFTDDRYTDDCHYRGGLLRKYYDIGYYGAFMVAMNALPPYPEWSGNEWANIWQQHLTHNEPYLLKWYRHQTDGDYWRPGSVGDAPEKIKCPVFMIGGWRDGYMNPPLRLFEALTAPRKVWIGPWNHAMPDTAIPGPRIDYLHQVVRWLDYWCKGKETGIMDEPPVTVYMQQHQPPEPDRLETSGHWRAETGWPPPGAQEMPLYLGDNHTLANAPPPTGDTADTFEYNPTVGLTGGLWSGGIQFGLPGDQRPDEALSLVYTTPPLQEDVHILGYPQAVLHVSSTAPVVGFAVSLCDVAPDGTSALVAKGMLNATRRHSLSDPQPLTPDEIYELNIQIDCTGWVFKAGHRIRLGIAGADWPNVWPTPHPATNQVHRGPQRPSRLILPTIPAQSQVSPPQFRPSPHHVGKHTDATDRPTWQVTRDMLTGQTTVDLSVSSKRRINDTIVLERESTSKFFVDPRNPAQAGATGRHIYCISRPHHQTQTRADVAVQATATHFHITIDLEVQVNHRPHFTRHWTESVPRQYL